jgi:hypothetical protein
MSDPENPVEGGEDAGESRSAASQERNMGTLGINFTWR